MDVNSSNIYDAGDSTDLGRAFNDDNPANETGGLPVYTYDTGEFQVPRASVAACVAGTGCAGDGVWGAADVRKQNAIIFAGSTAVVSVVNASSTNVTFRWPISMEIACQQALNSRLSQLMEPLGMALPAPLQQAHRLRFPTRCCPSVIRYH